tara:strand:- start:512 stop:778 length:267 start_codon:yes stop_codon:yes gene_type:complete
MEIKKENNEVRKSERMSITPNKYIDESYYDLMYCDISKEDEYYALFDENFKNMPKETKDPDYSPEEDDCDVEEYYEDEDEDAKDYDGK